MSDLVLCFTQLFLLGAQSLIVRLTPVLHISLHFLPMLGTCLCFCGLKLSILERFLELLDLRLERCELINLLLDRVFVLLSLCEKLGACLMHLVKFFLCVAHLLDDTLHLTGVSKLALDELSLKRLFDLGCQTELVIHTLVLVQDSLHVGSLSALQVSCLQFHSSILHAFNTCIVMQISTSQEWIEIILRCCMHRSICILNFLLLSRRRIRLKTCHIMPDKSYHVSERP